MFNHNIKHRETRNYPNGFTLAEMLISTAILLILITTATAISSNFFNALRNIQAADTVYDESNFTLERIIKEVRSGTVDYEEYYNQSNNFFGTETNETYGQNYCQYSRQFYDAGPDNKYGTYDDASTGKRKPDSSAPVNSLIQKKLYLIDTAGTHRTYVQRVEIEKTDNAGKPYSIGKVAILKLAGEDYGINHMDKGVNTPQCKDNGEGDGLIDTWVCDTGFQCAKKTVQFTMVSNGLSFPCEGTLQTPLDTPKGLDNLDPASGPVSSFVDITPETIDVVSLDFIVTPQEDPRKAYNDNRVQVQPNVAIKLTVRAAPKIASTFKGNTPTIVLESTVSARAAKEIITECNLQECIDGDPKPCPKSTGVLDGIKQVCSQGVWPGCSETQYETYAREHVQSATLNNNALGIEGTVEELAAITLDGLDHNPPFGAAGRSFYETAGSEIGSCVKTESGTEIPDEDCKRRRCTDGVDNDVNGKIDQADPACLYYLCTNGYLDPGEKCIDVGGVCEFMHPLEKGGETSCTDGYDNDCNYNFELGWDDFNSPPNPTQVISPAQKDLAIFRGAASSTPVAELNIALGQGADEYDQNCIDNVFCKNSVQDKGNFGPKDFETPNYLLPLSEKPVSEDLDEACVDIGGLCDWTTEGKNRLIDEPVGNKEYDPTVNLDATEPVDSYKNKFLARIKSGELCYDKLDNNCDYKPGDPKTGPDEFDPSCKEELCTNGFPDCRYAPPPPEENLTENFDFVSYLKNFDTICLPGADNCCSVPSTLNENCIDVGGLCRPEGEEGTPLPLENSNALTCSRTCPPESTLCVPNCMCFDGVDNDCGDGAPEGNGIDGVINAEIQLFSSSTPSDAMADTNCCPDGDGDHFAPKITNSCEPVGAMDPKSNGVGFIDCNDNVQAIYPGAPEICGDGIDSNCSLVNGIPGDDGTDNAESSCCSDSDMDGFGIEPANLPYDKSAEPRCMGSTSPMIDFSERTRWDCRDVGGENEVAPVDINPGVQENTKALCTDGANNSCRFVKEGGVLNQLKPKKDHIDMYGSGGTKEEAEASLMAASVANRFNPDCCPSPGINNLSDFYGATSAAAHHPGMEICDDANSLLATAKALGLGSDENCNGLEGYADHYCMGSDERSFFDNLSGMDYITNGTPPVKIDLAGGRIQLDVSDPVEDSPLVGDVSSKTLPLTSSCVRVATVQLIAHADLPLPMAANGITYNVSNDGGLTWNPIISESPGIAFSGGAKDLRWKASLIRNDHADPTPTLNDVTLKWTCD